MLDITVQNSNKILRVGDNISILCLFKGAIEAIIVQWLKDGSPIMVSSHSEKSQGDMFISNLTIYSISNNLDLANISCFGYYDESKVTAERTIISNTMSTILHVQDKGELVIIIIII